jgi:predicted permease
MTTLPEPTHRRARATAVGAAVLAPTVIWLVTVPLLGVDLQVAQPSGRPPARITLPLVIVTALAASLAGWGVLALLERRTRQARTIWTATAVVALVGSFAPLLAPGTPTTSRVVLGLMHLTVAAILIPSLARGAPADPAA